MSTPTDVEPMALPLSLKAPGNPAALKDVECDGAIVKLPSALMESMRRLGVQVKNGGVLNVDLGYAIATKSFVYECAAQLAGRMEVKEGGKPLALEELVEIGGALSKLSGAMNKLAAKNFGSEDAPLEVPRTPKKSFAAGQTAQFHLHKHFHGKPENEPAPKD